MGLAARALTREHDQIRAHTASILTLCRATDGYTADKVVKIGRHLRAVKGALPRREWLRWLDEDVPFTVRSARNYIQLAVFAEAHPADFQRLRPLGPSRLYAVLHLPLEGLLHLRDKPLEAMLALSTPQFHAFVRELGDRPVEPPPPSRLVRSARARVRHLRVTVDRLIAARQQVDRAQGDRLVAEMEEAVAALRAAGFGA